MIASDAHKDGIIDSVCCTSCPLQRRSSVMKRFRRSFRRAISNKEVMMSENETICGAIRPSLSSETFQPPESFNEEPYIRRFSVPLTFSATSLWESLVSHLEANVNPGTRRRSLRMYPDCFFGHEAVDCLHKYITTDLSRRCDRDQIAILCHRFLVLGIIEGAKYAPENDRDFNTGLLYRLTSEKKFWELSFEKSVCQDMDRSYKDDSPDTITTCLSDGCAEAAVETFDKCKNSQQRRSFRQSVFSTARYFKLHSREHQVNLNHELPSDTQLCTTSDGEETKQLHRSVDTKSSSNVDSSFDISSTKVADWKSEEILQTVHVKAKKPTKRRWYSIREKLARQERRKLSKV